MPHRNRIRTPGARSGGQMCRRAASSPPARSRPSPPCPQPCRAGSTDAAHAAAQRWRWNRHVSRPQSPVTTALATVPCRAIIDTGYAIFSPRWCYQPGLKMDIFSPGFTVPVV
uniref:Uncharacterized protein n=1 Tax=Oryza sativa subsp. japonica TaxID=39947 RepID=Q7EYJ0_ORYSJ|nr:hypothetical protein [Oryza sativa Japonica Group]